MPTGMVQMWVFIETRDIIKALAAEAGVTISDMVRSRFEDAAVDAKGYTVEREKDAKLRDGDFKETGKGKAKSVVPFEYEGKLYTFRELLMTPKDEATWKKYREDDTWKAYCAWYKQEHYGADWRGDVEFEDPYTRKRG